MFGAQRAQNIASVAVGQQEVQQHQIELFIPHEFHGIAAGGGALHRVAFRTQPFGDEGSDAVFVLDEQDPHVASSST